VPDTNLGYTLEFSHIIVCKYLHMPTNLALDDKLIEEARKADAAQKCWG